MKTSLVCVVTEIKCRYIMHCSVAIVVVHVLFIVVTCCCRVRSVYEGVYIVVRRCIIVLHIVLYSTIHCSYVLCCDVVLERYMNCSAYCTCIMHCRTVHPLLLCIAVLYTL